MFDFNNYECIGFDWDHTLLEYNIPAMSELIYSALTNYLLEKKDYVSGHLTKTFSSGLSFLQRGLALDLQRGNIVKFGCKGEVFKVSHGTHFLSTENIRKVYGESCIWNVAADYAHDPFQAWNGSLGQEIRCVLDFFDMPAALVFARAVDSVNESTTKPVSYYYVWQDILDALNYNYRPECFQTNVGEYFPTVKSQPDLFIKKCPDSIINWLRKLKENGKVLFLITGSAVDYAYFTSQVAVGPKWKDLFDVIVTFARKPAFFYEERPFLTINGTAEGEPCTLKSDTHIVARGNWKELHQYFVEKTGIEVPRCVYVGDNLLQDVAAPVRFANCDAVAITLDQRNDCIWGDYLKNEDGNLTLWGLIQRDVAKYCAPNVAFIIQSEIEEKE